MILIRTKSRAFVLFLSAAQLGFTFCRSSFSLRNKTMFPDVAFTQLVALPLQLKKSEYSRSQSGGRDSVLQQMKIFG